MCAVANESFVLEEGTLGFEPYEADVVLKEYVCSVCHADLKAFQVPGDRNFVIVCVEHGNIEKIGRVMRSTVSIEIERGLLTYKEVVRNLSDLWPELVEDGFEYREAVSIRKHNVCKKCGGKLHMQFADNTGKLIVLKCLNGHNIEKDGYKKRR